MRSRPISHPLIYEYTCHGTVSTTDTDVFGDIVTKNNIINNNNNNNCIDTEALSVGNQELTSSIEYSMNKKKNNNHDNRIIDSVFVRIHKILHTKHLPNINQSM